jgi:hypothetical protein
MTQHPPFEISAAGCFSSFETKDEVTATEAGGGGGVAERDACTALAVEFTVEFTGIAGGFTASAVECEGNFSVL